MGKLFNLKKWLTVADAARHLSIVFGEDVTEADVLRLALDGHLRLSVHFVNSAPAKVCDDASHDECEWDVIELRGWRFSMINGQEVEIADVWDLPMFSGDRRAVENKIQMLTGGPSVRNSGVTVVELQGPNKEKPECCILDTGLPNGVVYVVRTEALREFERQSIDEPLSASHAHVSDKLAKMNQASTKFWSNADRDDRGTHPDNATVAAWLVQQGFSPTLADKAATIVRPEWAPTGRKPEE